MGQPPLDRVYAQAATGPGRAAMSTPDWKATRWALRTGKTSSHYKRALVNQIARTNRRIGRAWTLKEQLRDVYRIEHPPGGPPTCAAGSPPPNAAVSTLRPSGQAIRGLLRPHHHRHRTGHLQRPHRRHNAKIRLINARGYGHHSAQTLTSMIYLCLGGLQVTLPTTT